MINIIEKENEKKLIFVLFLGSVFIRVLYVVYVSIVRSYSSPQIEVLQGDAITYWNFAEAILKDTSWMTEHVNHRPPVYPIFLAFIAGVFGTGRNFLNVMLVQSVINSLSVIIIYDLAKRVFNHQTAIMAGGYDRGSKGMIGGYDRGSNLYT